MKQRLTDTLLARLQRDAKKRNCEIECYDTTTPELVVRIRPTGRVGFYRYADRRKTKLDAKTIAVARNKVANGAVRAEKAIPWRDLVEDHYRPVYMLTHKTERSLDALIPFTHTFADTLVTKITRPAVERWIAGRIDSGRSPKTIRRNLSGVRAVLNFGVERGYLSENPLATLPMPRIDDDDRERYLSGDEEARLSAALRSRDDELKAKRDRYNDWRQARHKSPLLNLSNLAYGDYLSPMVVLSIHTGLRYGELTAIEWRDVIDDMLTVRSNITKSQKTRHVPLNPNALEALNQWRAMRDGEGRIFPVDSVRKAWLGVLNAADITDFRWHDLRHHFASQLVMNGIPLRTVQKLLGHSTIAMTERYSHLAPGHLRDAVGTLAS